MSISRRIACSIHGSAVRMRCGVPALQDSIEHLVQPFLVSEWPDGFVPVDGTVQPYESAEVMENLPASARRYASADEKREIYAEGHRFWLVDDRWGMSEIDFKTNTWRSWILPTPTVAMHEVAELSMVWPMAQLLRGNGLYLMPGIALARGEWGMLVLCPSGMEPEISAMVQSGYQVIGQRWIALREEDGGVAMLHLPGHVERGTTRRIRPRTPKPGASLTEPSSWIDLIAETPAASKNYAFCQAVVLVEGSRRPEGWVRPVSAINSLQLLRQQWPKVELNPTPRSEGRMMIRLAELCPIFEMRLSRNPAEAVEQLESIRCTGAPAITEQRARQQALWEATPPLNLTPWSLAG